MRKLAALTLAALLSLPVMSWAGSITATSVAPTYNAPGQAIIYTWAHLTSTNPTAVAVDVRKYSSLEVQIKGTWGAGTLTFTGSDDASNYVTLTGMPAGVPTAISYSSDPTTLLPVWESPKLVKPLLSGANGTDDITVTLIGRQ